MYYDRISLKQEGDNFFLFDYIPYYSRNRNEITLFLLDFKDNVPDVVREVQDISIQTLLTLQTYLQRRLKCKYVVSIPPHESDHANIPCEQVCAALGQRFGWLTHLPGALGRTQTVPKSAGAAPGRRPDYSMHVNTIEYAGPSLYAPNDSIIMVDDIYTSGAISAACRDILEQATGCKRVVGLFIGRTVYS